MTWTQTGEIVKRDGHKYERCVCSCGAQAWVYLRSGRLNSKECDVCSRGRGRNRSHGFTVRKKGGSGFARPEWLAWSNMRTRCEDPKHIAWKNYGGRGIRVCKRREKFENFIADMGDRPDGMSLDRKNNDGNYEPENCRWATAKEQGRNRRTNRPLTFAGETHLLAVWAERFGLGVTTLRERLRMGWDVKDALTLPVSWARRDRK